MTRPAPFTVVLGLTWNDSADGHDNEDMHVVNEDTMEITPTLPAEFGSKFPEYVPYHHEAKDFLRDNQE